MRPPAAPETIDPKRRRLIGTAAWTLAAAELIGNGHAAAAEAGSPAPTPAAGPAGASCAAQADQGRGP
jgi:hypothetical protein